VWDVRSIGVNCLGVHDMDGRARRKRAEKMTFGQKKKKYLMTTSEKNEKISCYKLLIQLTQFKVSA
jgi:hypothetical protein